MNYNQHITPEISRQSVSKLTQMLGDQLKKLLDQSKPDHELKLREIKNTETVQPPNRTSEDVRLEFLGYNY